MATSYNVRIVDNGDGTFTIPWAHKCRSFVPHHRDSNGNMLAGEWVSASPKPVLRMLAKAFADRHKEVNDT